MTKLFLFIWTLLFFSCQEQYSRKEVRLLLQRGEKEDLVKAYYLIGQNRDTSFLRDVMANPYDPRIVHVAEFYGMSVYQCKMNALKRISGVLPPRKITYLPDSAVVNFYCRWINRNTSLKCDERSKKPW
jgi:hypothetical protein